MKRNAISGLFTIILTMLAGCSGKPPERNVGVGTKPTKGAEVLFDGTRAMLDEKCTYWQGPAFASTLPIKWKIVEDAVDGRTCVMSDHRAPDAGRFGTA